MLGLVRKRQFKFTLLFFKRDELALAILGKKRKDIYDICVQTDTNQFLLNIA